MATTESSAVMRLINSVQGQPILDSFREPIPDPVSAPEAPPLQADFPTVMVRAPQRSRWPWYTLGAIALLGGAIGVGYVIGQGGHNGPMAQSAAGAAPMLAQTDEPQRAVAEPSQAERAVAPIEDGAEPTAPQQRVAFDAAFDIIVQPAGAIVFLDGKELGPSPLRIGRLAAGAHTLEIQGPEGYQGKTVPVELISGERQVIRLSLDGVEAETQAVVAEAAEEQPGVQEPAKRSFRTKRPVRKATTESKAKPDKVSRRSRSKKARRKTRVTKSSGKMGTLMIGSKPPCKIYIDGKNTGLTTPQRAIKVKAGKHKITLVNKQHGIRATATVIVRAGQTKRVIKDMSSRL